MFSYFSVHHKNHNYYTNNIIIVLYTLYTLETFY